MNIKSLICMAALPMVFSGCATPPDIFGGYSIKPISEGMDGSYGKLVDELQKNRTGGAMLEKRCFAAVLANGDKSDCRTERNQAVSALVVGSSEMCLAHRRSIYGREAAWNITLGTMTNVFAGAASVVHKESLRPVLAALALFSNSERSLVNETVYKQMLVTAVDKKIVEMRETKLTHIYDMLKQPLDKYTVQEALRDVVEMHSTCSFIDGLQKALDEGTQGTAAQKITRLKMSLMSVQAQYDMTADKTTPAAKALADRMQAISVALSAEEIR